MRIPSQKVVYLGFRWDSRTMQISLPGDKVRKIQKEVKSLILEGQCSIRRLDQVIGLLNSTTQAVFPCRMNMNRLLFLKKISFWERNRWESIVLLSAGALEELRWWRENREEWNGRFVIHQAPHVVLTSDASIISFGDTCGELRTRGF
eukprot:GEZU01027828.1.p2 GENE.GEZU01027828.1~~GEZU01027828.1.p2  ORF type:complete len:148 (+),score=13.85 GEZU01027828.1:1063-1506(+)